MNEPGPVDKPIRIIQITDFHLLADPLQTMMGISTEQSLLQVIDLAWRNHPQTDLILMTGDLVQEPGVATYTRLKKRLEMLPVPCYCLPGNHDQSDLIRTALAGDNIAYPAQILLDGWQIVCLDSTLPDDPGGFLAEAQLAILEAKLLEQPERHALVCLHHSPLPTGTEWLDTMTLSNAEAFFALIERFPRVKAVVYGHIHQAMEVTHNELLLLGCPSTCFQFKQGSADFALDAVPQGYRWIDLYPDGSIRTGVVRMDALPEGLDLSSSGYQEW
ncbi:MAG: 3',5'-cyclic-AMP phosphodiesterase [Methylococcaceae bacterium]|nr:3',5'-cyclic-AMP phosphodiesterase [Methylococcaceae bacterium]